MNLLIVDDEYYSVEGVRQTLAASDLPLDEIFCAYSMENAQEIFSSHQVDILLSDIEMPGGSGLELLEWVRAQGFQAVGIFLTSYATFDYASRALKLESEDYLLKPVDREKLLSAVGKAVEKCRRILSERFRAEYWDRNQIRNVEAFWRSLAVGGINPSQKIIEHELSIRQLPLETAQSRWLPALLSCRKTKDAAAWEKPLYEYAVRNILNETLFSKDELPLAPLVADNQYILFRYPREGQSLEERTLELLQAVKNCEDSLPGVFHIFPHNAVCGAREIGAVCEALREQASNAIYEKSMVFSAENTVGSRPAAAPPWEKWNDMLLSKKGTQVRQEAMNWFSSLRTDPRATRRELVSFHRNFLQILHNLLKTTDLQAYNSFCASDVELSDEACDSIGNLQEWVTSAIDMANVCLMKSACSSGVVEKVKQYIEDHLSEELTRNQLAARVYLSPDYLSHLFIEKEQVSLTDYIIARRIHRAKKLLLQGKLRISDIALQSGFQNISYFSKQFKKQTGTTPQEFRKSQLQ